MKMFEREILEFFKAITDCMGSKVFRGVCASNGFLTFETTETVAMIVNTDVDSGPGEHWLAFYIENEVLEFFDSFGRPPEDFNQHIESYVKKFRSVNYFSHCFQDDSSYNCGQFCIFYIIRRLQGHKMEHIFQELTACTNCDEYVRNFYIEAKSFISSLRKRKDYFPSKIRCL